MYITTADNTTGISMVDTSGHIWNQWTNVTYASTAASAWQVWTGASAITSATYYYSDNIVWRTWVEDLDGHAPVHAFQDVHDFE